MARGLQRFWWLFLAVAAALALIAAFGGFARAAPVDGPRVATGESIELARFRVVVDRVELVDTDDYGSEADPAFQVWLQATTTGERSTDGLPYGMVVVVADGVALPAGYARPVDGWNDALDPDLPRPIRYVVDWTAGGTPGSLQVVVFDETPGQGFLDDSASLDVDTSHPAAVVPVTLLDLRKRR